MIEFQHISKAFDGKKVLDGVSGKFEQGKVNLIIGESGTGKSVLIKCIVGLIRPDQGSIAFDGRDFLNGSKDRTVGVRKEIGMLFQGGALFDSKNVEENVLFPLDMLTDMPQDAKLDRVNFCLQRVGLSNANKKMPNELSGGMQKRVGVARAIVNNSKYLFCDEPTSGLDAKTGLLIDELIQELTYEYNIATIVVTHDMDSIVSIGDYILFLHQGRKTWEGASADIFHVDVEALKDFLFASKLMRMAKPQA
ncbi:MAG TPA: ABC transporter ATP-binding protein [Amoebophilaceae bacterium]|nr:ABC transporter ATP-binding protein [Amoebophilaceae bacterium]